MFVKCWQLSKSWKIPCRTSTTIWSVWATYWKTKTLNNSKSQEDRPKVNTHIITKRTLRFHLLLASFFRSRIRSHSLKCRGKKHFCFERFTSNQNETGRARTRRPPKGHSGRAGWFHHSWSYERCKFLPNCHSKICHQFIILIFYFLTFQDNLALLYEGWTAWIWPFFETAERAFFSYLREVSNWKSNINSSLLFQLWCWGVSNHLSTLQRTALMDHFGLHP